MPALVVVLERMAPGDSFDSRLKQPTLIAFEDAFAVSFLESAVHGVIFLVIWSCLRRAPMLEREASGPYPKVKPGVTLGKGKESELKILCIASTEKST